MGDGFKSAVGAIAGLAVVGTAGRAITSFFQASIQGAQDAEKATVRLASALASVGRGGDLDGLEAYSASLEKLLKIDADLIKENMAVLVTMGYEEKQVKRLTQLSLDLADGMKMELGGAFKLVGRAAQGNTLMLQKMGIQLDLSEDKTVAATQAVSQLEQLFRGRATSAANTYDRRVAGLNLTYEAFQEAVGQAITTNEVLRQVLAVASGQIDVMSGSLGTAESRSTALNGAFLSLVKGAVFVAKAAVGIKAAFEIAGNGISGFIAAIGQGFSAAAAGIASVFEFIEEKSNDAGQAIDRLLNRPVRQRTSFFGDIRREADLLSRGFESTLDKSIKNIGTSMKATAKEFGGLDELIRQAEAASKRGSTVGKGGAGGGLGFGNIGGTGTAGTAAAIAKAAQGKTTITLGGQKLTLESSAASAVEKAFLEVLEKTGQKLVFTAAHSDKIQISAQQAANQTIRNILEGYGLLGTGKAGPNPNLLSKGQRAAEAGIPALPPGIRGSGSGSLPTLPGMTASSTGRSFQFRQTQAAEGQAVTKYREEFGALAAKNVALMFQGMQGRVNEIIYNSKMATAEAEAKSLSAAMNLAEMFNTLAKSGGNGRPGVDSIVQAERDRTKAIAERQPTTSLNFASILQAAATTSGRSQNPPIDQIIYQNKQDAEAIKQRKAAYEDFYKVAHNGFESMARDLQNGQSLWQIWSNRVKSSIQEAILKMLAMKAASAMGASAAGGGGFGGAIGSVLGFIGGGGLPGLGGAPGGGLSPGGVGDFVSMPPVGRMATSAGPSSVSHKVGGTIRLENTNGQAVDVNDPNLINAIVAYAGPVAQSVYQNENSKAWAPGGTNQRMVRSATR